MKKLIQGIIDFRKNLRPGYRETFARLALGQSPDALLIACSDSRVAPNLFASTEPGDLFVVRNPGNLISPCGADGRSVSDESEAAAIEFSTLALNVRDIIVCGHSSCGAMRMLHEGKAEFPAPHLQAWLRHSEAALKRVQKGDRMPGEWTLQDQVSQFNVLAQLDNLRTYPLIKERLAQGRIRLHAWWFDIAQAEVLSYDDRSKRFSIIDESEMDRHLH